MDSEGNSSTAYGCTPRWTAPEILNGGVASREGDIFSFAMVMIEVRHGRWTIFGKTSLAQGCFISFQVFNGAVPFSNNSNDAGTSFILEGKRPERPKHPIFTDELWLLMQRCWKDDPSSRPPTSEVLKILEVLTCRRLAGHDPTRPQRICLINAVFSDHNWSKVIDHVDDDCAQEFLDAVDEVDYQMIPRSAGRSTNHGYNSPILSIRCWRTSHRRFARGVCALYTGYAVAKPSSHDHWCSRFAITSKAIRCTKENLRTCGNVYIMARGLPPGFEGSLERRPGQNQKGRFLMASSILFYRTDHLP